MARPRFKSSIKPAGWRGDSHRHYLAAKGIKTTHQYFVNDLAKGNRTSSGLHKAHAKGFTKDDLRRDPSARDAFGVSLEELNTRRRRILPEDLSRAEESQDDLIVETEVLPQEVSSVEQPQQPFQPQSPEEVRDPVLMSSATSPVPGPDSAFFAKKEIFKK